MDALIYQAALICPDCADDVTRILHHKGKADTGDSGDWPQGPYADGGGEADTPQHCDHCCVFLENPLTDDGRNYVQDKLDERDGDREVLRVWSKFYEMSSKKKGKWSICPVCDGEGSHVNPNIDAGGLTAEDFREDPDFAEDYFSGRYDVGCQTCNGSGKVQDIDEVYERLAQHADERRTRMYEDGVWEPGVGDYRFG